MRYTKELENILSKVRQENSPTQADVQWANKEYELWKQEQDKLFGKDGWKVEIVKGDMKVVAK